MLNQNKINQTGGFTAYEYCKNIIDQYVTGSFHNIKNRKYVIDFLQAVLVQGPSPGEYLPNPLLFTNELGAEDFYSGLYNAFTWIFDLVTEMEEKGFDLSTSNLPTFILVDGINIIRNPDILLGFLPLVSSNMYESINNVVQLIYDANLSISKASYDNLLYVLDNILPLILENINLPEYTNVVIIQHIGHVDNITNPEVRARALSTEFYGKIIGTKIFDYVKIAKIKEDGKLVFEPLSRIKYEKEPKYIGKPDSFKKSAESYSDNAMVGITSVLGSHPEPVFAYKFEGDDVTLVCINYFLRKVLKLSPKSVYLFSGDNYKWFNDRNILKNRLVLEYDINTNSYNPLELLLKGNQKIQPTELITFKKDGNIMSNIDKIRFIHSWDFVQLNLKIKLVTKLFPHQQLPRNLRSTPYVQRMDIDAEEMILEEPIDEMEGISRGASLGWASLGGASKYREKYLKYKIKYHLLTQKITENKEK